jgi:Chaperone of endosialidase
MTEKTNAFGASSFDRGREDAKVFDGTEIEKFRASFEQHIDRIESLLQERGQGQQIFLHFDFNGKHWYEFEPELHAIDQKFSDAAVTPTATNQTIFRSSGGYWLYSNSGLTAGVTLSPGGGAWSTISDRNMKANFAAVDTRGVLGLPISTWNYKSQDASVRHIGPMAQDFFATFKVGEGDKTITTIDPDGVALAAIQGLNAELKDRDARIDDLQQQLKRQQEQIDGLKKLLCLGHPEAAVCKEGR